MARRFGSCYILLRRRGLGERPCAAFVEEPFESPPCQALGREPEEMITLERILVPVDFSKFSRHALKYGCAFAKEFNSELHLLHVLHDLVHIVPETGTPLPTPDTYFRELRESVQRALDELPGSLWKGGKGIVRELRTGTPFLEIVRYAREKEIDLIVLGTHGRGALVHLLLGSVAEKVVRKAPCPVLTVRHPEHEFVVD